MENWLKDAGEIIVTILKEGGSRALWGLGMYLIYELLRIVFIGGAIWLCGQAVSTGICRVSSQWLKLRETRRTREISLLSSEVSDHLKSHIEQNLKDSQVLQQGWQATLSRIEDELKKLEESSASSKSDSPENP